MKCDHVEIVGATDDNDHDNTCDAGIIGDSVEQVRERAIADGWTLRPYEELCPQHTPTIAVGNDLREAQATASSDEQMAFMQAGKDLADDHGHAYGVFCALCAVQNV